MDPANVTTGKQLYSASLTVNKETGALPAVLSVLELLASVNVQVRWLAGDAPVCIDLQGTDELLIRNAAKLISHRVSCVLSGLDWRGEEEAELERALLDPFQFSEEPKEELLACKLCIAQSGLRGSDIQNKLRNCEELNAHIEAVHHVPVMRPGEAPEAATARFLAAHPEGRSCPTCCAQGAPWTKGLEEDGGGRTIPLVTGPRTAVTLLHSDRRAALRLGCSVCTFATQIHTTLPWAHQQYDDHSCSSYLPLCMDTSSRDADE